MFCICPKAAVCHVWNQTKTRDFVLHKKWSKPGSCISDTHAILFKIDWTWLNMIKQYKKSAEQTTIPSCFFPQRPLPKHNVTTSKWGTWANPKDPPTGTGYPAIPTPMIIFPKYWGSFRRNFCFGQTQNHIVDHTMSYIHIQLDLIIIILSLYTTYNHIYVYIYHHIGSAYCRKISFIPH